MDSSHISDSMRYASIILNKAINDTPLSKVIDARHTSSEFIRQAAQVPLSALRDIWFLRFGESIDAQYLLEQERVLADDFMIAVGATLRRWGFLEYDHARQTYILHDKPKYADYRQQSSTI